MMNGREDGRTDGKWKIGQCSVRPETTNIFGEGDFLWRRRKTEKEKEENIWRREIFHLRRRGRTEKKKEEMLWRRKFDGDANQPTGQL